MSNINDVKNIMELDRWFPMCDVGDFELLEIPHPKVFCFGNEEKGEYFDVVKFFDDKWQFSYIENGSNKLAHSIEEAIMKNEWLK